MPSTPTEAKHTPLPWTVTDNSWEVSSVYGPDGELVAQCPIDSDVDEDTQDEFEPVKEANARLIVKCVNERASLLSLIEDMAKALEAAKKRMRNCRGAIESNQVVDKDTRGSLTNGMADLDAALSRYTEFMEQNNA